MQGDLEAMDRLGSEIETDERIIALREQVERAGAGAGSLTTPVVGLR